MKIKKVHNGYMVYFEKEDYTTSKDLIEDLKPLMKEHGSKWIWGEKAWRLPNKPLLLTAFKDKYNSYRKNYLESRINLEDFTDDDMEKLINGWSERITKA